MSFIRPRGRDRSRMHSLLLFVAVAVFLPIGGGCERPPPAARAVRPPVEIDDAVAERLLAAMRELADLSRAHPSSGGRPLPISLGITALLGKDVCEPIVRRHGFANCRDFESRLGYVQAILMERIFGERRGFDADAQAYRIRASIQAARSELEALGRDTSLTEADRRLERARIRRRIEALEERLEEVDDVADAIDHQFEGVPEEVREAVLRRLDDFAALMVPQLVRRPDSGKEQE